MLLNRLDPVFFLGSFLLGLLFVYLTTPARQVVIKFPSPLNAGRVVYRNGSDSCFKYRADKGSCPADAAKIRTQPIVEEDFGNRK